MKRLTTWTVIVGLIFLIPADSTAAILHTSNGGKTWKEQGDPALWEGMTGNDISAVDEWTAWAAVGGNDGGAILHTSNGGFTWDLQPLPAGMTDAVKGIKGLSQKIAWAVTSRRDDRRGQRHQGSVPKDCMGCYTDRHRHANP